MSRAAIDPVHVHAGASGTRGCTVVKVGGGLLAQPGALAVACEALLAAQARGRRIVVVAGGGPFANAVREADHAHQLGHDAAHWMATLAMDQYAHWLARRLPGSLLVTSTYETGAALDSGHLAIFAVATWLRDADTLPHSWALTSDSIAAFTAGALDAARLVLVKPVSGLASQLVDDAFASVAPVGLRVDAVSVSDLPTALSAN